MNYKLLTTTFIGFFGVGSEQPRRATAWRLFVIVSGAIFVSWLMQKSISTMHLPQDLPHEWLIFAAILTWQSAICLVIWLSSATLAAGRDKLSHILMLWPVSKPVIWLTRSLPSLTLAAIVWIACFWPLSVIASKLSFPPLIWVTATIIGLASGLAIGLYRPAQKLFSGVIIGACLLWAEFLLLQLGLTQLQVSGTFSLFVILGLPILICLPGLWLIIELRMAADALINRTSSRPILSVPWKDKWLAQKILRNRRSRLAWSVTGLASAALTIGCIIQRVPLGDGHVLAFVGAILACGMATDMRPIARRQSPFEILGLRGTQAYVLELGLSTFALAVLAVSPLLGLMAGASGKPEIAGLYGLSLVAFGTSIGLLAGIIFVPENKDISAQLAAAASSSVLLILLTRWSWFQQQSDGGQAVLLLIGAALFLAMSCLIEQQRHKIYWRLNHA